MDMFFTCILLIIQFMLQDLSNAIAVHLAAEKYVRRHGTVNLNCSSDFTPFGNAAEILVNSKSVTDIRYFRNECFYVKSKCLSEICDCSTDGRWFTYTYIITQKEAFVEFACIMRYGLTRIYSYPLNVTIIDFIGPEILMNTSFPLIVGTTAELQCQVQSPHHNVVFDWICTNKTAIKNVQKNNIHISVFSFMVIYSYHGKNCTCAASLYGLTSRFTLKLEVSREPVLKSTNFQICQNFSTITLNCSLSAGQTQFGFHHWEHRFNGVLIRKLEGVTTGRRSTLTIAACSYLDAGEYICIAWTDYAENVSNKTIYLTVNGPPLIMGTSIFREQRLLISIWFLSPDKAENSTVWYLNNNQIFNSTPFLQTIAQRQIRVNVYETIIYREGYEANCSAELTFRGELAVLLRNSFGIRRHSFEIQTVLPMFDLRSLVLGITAFGIFLLTSTCATIAMKCRCFKQIFIIGGQNLGPSSVSVYHSAPQFQIAPHLYDTPNAEPQYLEVIDNKSDSNNSDTNLKVIASAVVNNEADDSSSSGYEEVV